MKNVLQLFGLDPGIYEVNPHGTGLINDTWAIKRSGEAPGYILQKVNRKVFKAPEDIAFNLRLISGHLKKKHPGYLFTEPLLSVAGEDMVKVNGEYFRLFEFVKGSHAVDVAASPAEAFEAAKQFARFARMLSDIDVSKLRITLPDFHNLSLRYAQFEDSLLSAEKERLDKCSDLIGYLLNQHDILDEYAYCRSGFKTRAIHHDTKISNVLFNDAGKGICVIDLDTVMPGLYISDVGDMMRTYLSPVSEEEKDFSLVTARESFYDAIVDGYLQEMGDELSAVEREHFHFSGKFMIYMQALRFLTDYLNNDVYYGSRYEGHNLVRAGNQATLLRMLIAFNPG